MDIKNCDVKTCLQSKKVKIGLCVIGGIAVALLIFKAGMFVGYKKAGFSYGMEDNYHKIFGGRKNMMKGYENGFEKTGKFGGGMRQMMGFFGDREFSNAYGASGKIVKIELPNLVVADKDGTEKIIVINEKTEIRRLRETIKPEDIKENDTMIVVGAPNAQSQIEAKLIRIMSSSL